MRSILHIDMDAFYASVEQRDNPAYRGKPVVVGANPQGGKGRGVVSAASYEARTFGIHSAMPISEAYRRCPSAIFLPVRMTRYEEVSERIFEIFSRYTDLVEPLSLDEAFLDVTGSYALFGSAETIGRRIQSKILKEEQLQASVGIASNKFVAKVASDLEKPQGFVMVPHQKIHDFLRNLPLTRLWGVGAKTAPLLQQMGYRTIGDIAQQSQEALRARFGKRGVHLWQLANGLDDRLVVPRSTMKSIGAETTFSHDTNDDALIRQTLLALSERVGQRLRNEHQGACGLTLKFRNTAFETLTRSCSWSEPVNQAGALWKQALILLGRVGVGKQKVRLLGLSVTKLISLGSHEQLTLFEPDSRQEHDLSEAVDTIRTRFGDEAIQLGSLLGKEKP
ncbi:MAG: DNA polymerase IV [Nitrospirales bacterium]|nr:MAG: DNA polymerase IV [Nitrospirales bacterium]